MLKHRDIARFFISKHVRNVEEDLQCLQRGHETDLLLGCDEEVLTLNGKHRRKENAYLFMCWLVLFIVLSFQVWDDAPNPVEELTGNEWYHTFAPSDVEVGAI